MTTGEQVEVPLDGLVPSARGKDRAVSVPHGMAAASSGAGRVGEA